MEVLGLAVAIVLAAGGWIVNGVLTRRATRRDLRVQYLLSAYRALDAASNRAGMSAQHEQDVEAAVADVVLMGTEQQVELANAFSRTFADDGHADTSPLLEALRSDLRRELLLGDVGPRSTWLRIESGRRWAHESARVRAGLAAQAHHAPIERADTPPLPAGTGAEPVETVLAAYRDLEDVVRQRHPAVAGFDNGPVEVAVQQSLVSSASAQSLEGLKIMRDLAVGAPERLSDKEASDFVTLARAASYAIKTEKLDR